MKKVIIFTCIGGHNTISASLKEQLGQQYNIRVMNIFLDIIRWFDPIRILSFGFQNAETYYGFLIRNRMTRFLNKTFKPSLKVFNLLHYFIHKKIKNAIIKERPKCIISVIPWFNDHFVAIAKELNIPFFLMPTDIELSHFFYNIEKISYEKFYFLIPIYDMYVYDYAIAKGVLPNQIILSGVALKSSFFVSHDQYAVRSRFSIPQAKPVVLLLMGSQGSTSIIDYVKMLAKIKNLSFHLIIVLGANATLRQKVRHIQFEPLITCSIFDFTPFIPQLMSIATVLITKSGGISISEALYMDLPMFLDATSEVIFWEQKNQDFVEKNEFGSIIHSLKDVPQLLVNVLQKENNSSNIYKNNMQFFEKKNGSDTVRELLDKVIE
ncbi:hypothetical protein IPH25_02050 [bacterium]|nr:MAG: hypothetical protein IPG37_04180 [bacterium]QQR62207.1 MAG: hypothetical protein IPH25_02050 [bacterium]QQR63234.1 MAG: hypothetical protein IPH67_02045 [bacterium]